MFFLYENYNKSFYGVFFTGIENLNKTHCLLDTVGQLYI